MFLTYLSYVFILYTLDVCTSCSDDNNGVNRQMMGSKEDGVFNVNKMLDSLMVGLKACGFGLSLFGIGTNEWNICD